ncbi:signal peptidase complex subunit 3-like [Halichondria panicea]|uniref:signal peptidase complex subunit 3-like n=1 Tax=Halichondria panicea TaxID=6063 RepID=UPI00312B48EA
MNTALSRVNSVFAYNLTTLAALAVLVFLSTNFKDKTLETKISVASPKVRFDIERMASGPERKDYGVVKLDIEADLTDLFDWNTKELFVMVIAYYETSKTDINQIVLWDKIIQRGEPAKITLNQAKPEYRFFDDGKGLLGNENVTLQLSWNVIPHVGRLPLVYSNTYQIKFPTNYISGAM